MWTKFAIENSYIREEKMADGNSSFYFAQFRNGNYIATGWDVDDRRIRREYVVNDMVDHKSVWAMWNDFNGRWGLRRLWHVRDDGTRRLIYSEY